MAWKLRKVFFLSCEVAIDLNRLPCHENCPGIYIIVKGDVHAWFNQMLRQFMPTATDKTGD